MQDMVGCQLRRRPGERRDPPPPMAVMELGCGHSLPGFERLWLWVPAFAGTTWLFREPVRPALFHRALERRPRMHALQPRGEIRIRPDPVEHFCHFGNKAHLDIRACQRVADKELAPLQRALDIAEMP